MILEQAGRDAIAAALSGSVGLLAGDVEADGFPRQPVNLTAPSRLMFGPARQRVTITGVGVYQSGRRVLTQPFAEPARLGVGQRLELTVEFDSET